MIGAISVIGTRWLYNIQISVQMASGEFYNCGCIIQSKVCAAMNFIAFMKVASQVIFRGFRGSKGN